MTRGSPERPGGSAKTAARAELLDRLGHFAVTPRVIVDLGGEVSSQDVALQHRFPDARLIALAFADTPDPASPRAGVDGQPDARRWWRKMVAAMTGSPIRAERLPATLERLPLAEGSVDLVLAHWLMPGPPAVDALLAEVRRLLVPGGLFLWTTLGPGTRTDYAGTSALVDMHDLGSALGRAGFLEPVLDVDRLIDLDTRQSAAGTAADMNLAVAICEVIHVAAFAGEAAQRTNADSDGASETLVPLAAIGRRERSAR